MTDQNLVSRIIALQSTIIEWASNNDLWRDCVFSSYLERFDDEPSETSACITVLATDGSILEMLNGFNYAEAFTQLIEILDRDQYYHEVSGNCMLFYTNDEMLNQAFVDYFEWQWICSLVKPEYTSLYEEIYAWFAKSPANLQRLDWRKFEILVSEIFRNRGYEVQLGTGRNDGGVDLRLFERKGIDQITTLAQIKKYKTRRPIGLEAVSSLFGHMVDQKADKGLFVTASRFLPVANRFAARHKEKITLADAKEVNGWMQTVESKIVRDKSELLTGDHIMSMLQNKSSDGLEGSFVCASAGFNMTFNDFCIILKDEPHIGLLMRVPREVLEYYDAPYNTRGSEIPCMDERVLQNRNKENVFRAKKKIVAGKISYSGQHETYWLWDGRPQYFNLMD